MVLTYLHPSLSGSRKFLHKILLEKYKRKENYKVIKYFQFEESEGHFFSIEETWVDLRPDW